MPSTRHRPWPALVHPLICLVALLLLAGGPSRAQSPLAALALPAAAKPAAPAPAKPAGPPALTPAENRQIIDLLNDPQKRAAFTATLETLQKAVSVVSPAKPATPMPLAPDSVGAQVIRESSTWMAGLSAQWTSFGRVLGDLPSVWAFSVRAANTPAMRNHAVNVAWRLGLVLGLAGFGEYGLWLALRRPMQAIARAAPASPPPAPASADEARIEADLHKAETAAPPDPDTPGLDAGDTSTAPLHDEQENKLVETVLRRRRFSRTIATLRRLPFVLLCFLLDLLPMGVFLGIGYAGTVVFPGPHMQAILQAAILSYTICRLATSLARMIFEPDLPSLRLVHVSNAGAIYGVLWVRRIFVIATVGYAASQIGLVFGLPVQADEAFLKAVFLVVHACLIVIVLQCRASVAARIRSPKPDPGIGGRVRNRVADIWHLVAIFYIAGLWLIWAAEVRNGYLRIWHVFLITAGVLIVARLFSIILLGGLDRAFRATPEAALRHPGQERRSDHYYPLLRGVVSALLVLLTCLALLEAWGIDTWRWFHGNALGGKLASASLAILIAAALSVIVWEAVNASADAHVAKLTRQSQFAKSARLRTLLPILRTVLAAVLIAIFALTTLSEVGVDIAPLLAGAGILGVAIGFGSQKLVQDFITGMFLLVENAMQVGDWVTVASLSGTVENLSIRTMRLRAGDGSVHIIPFSSVSTVTNVNRGIGNAAVTVSVPIEEDSDQVCELLSDIARAMRQDARFTEMMRSDLQLWGVDRVDGGIVTIAGQIVCTDAGRWAVQREFNRRMAIGFKEQGLRIATPVQTVYTHTVTGRTAPAPTQDAHDMPAGQVVHSPPPAALGNTS